MSWMAFGKNLGLRDRDAAISKDARSSSEHDLHPKLKLTPVERSPRLSLGAEMVHRLIGKRDLCGRFGPGRLDPIRRRSRLVMGRTGFRPAHRRGDVADRNGDDAVRIPRRE